LNILIPASALGVAFLAASGDVQNPFLGVVLFRLRFIVAAIAVDILVRSFVACRAVAASPAVVHRKAVPGDIYVAPVVGAVALRALSTPVSGRR